MKSLSKKDPKAGASILTSIDSVIDVVDDFVLITPLPIHASGLPPVFHKTTPLPPVARPAVAPPIAPHRVGAGASLRSAHHEVLLESPRSSETDGELARSPKLPPVRPPPVRTAKGTESLRQASAIDIPVSALRAAAERLRTALPLMVPERLQDAVRRLPRLMLPDLQTVPRLRDRLGEATPYLREALRRHRLRAAWIVTAGTLGVILVAISVQRPAPTVAGSPAPQLEEMIAAPVVTTPSTDIELADGESPVIELADDDGAANHTGAQERSRTTLAKRWAAPVARSGPPPSRPIVRMPARSTTKPLTPAQELAEEQLRAAMR